MKKSWLLDTIFGVMLTFMVLAFAYFEASFLESFEQKLYDIRLCLKPKTELSKQIVPVVIDDDSIESVGRWPWPRGYIAQLIDKIAADGPRVIGLNILYTEPEQNQGLEVVRDLRMSFNEVLQGQKKALKPFIKKAKRDSRYKRYVKKDPLAPFDSVKEMFDSAESTLDNDAQLAQTLMATPGVVLPMIFTSLDESSDLTDETDEALVRMKGYSLSNIKTSERPYQLKEVFDPLIPIESFFKGASGFGHSNMFPDNDGSMRRKAVILSYQDHIFPSLALEMARVALGLNSEDIQVKLGHEIRLGNRHVPLDSDNTLLVNYQGEFRDLKSKSAIDVLAGDVPAGSFKNKIVLVGIMATGIGANYVVPVESVFPSAGIVVTVLQNILGGDYLVRPEWAETYELLVILFAGLFVVLLLPRLKARWAAVSTAIFILSITIIGFYFFMAMNYWIKIFYPLALLILAYAVITVRRFFFTERRKELVEAEGIETNKMLGLSFQGQGMLDMAFEKFRKCPVDEAMKELLYNLALDFERKRQFNKALVVYEHIGKVHPGYKDIKDKLKLAKTAGETMVMGGGLGGSRKEGTVVIEGASVKPTLGRYEIEKELGRGAMGIVYLGKDPKINRKVAIKTLKFDDDIDEQSIHEIKERFFREAESAGTLNHPNIVRIFDAGDDHDISFIAMELLNGEDLKKYCHKDNLFPVPKVLEYAALVADALDYAHKNGVIHRDIKPANIMLLQDGTLRVTDYGIARITASSKTQTGTVMGTPSYMSPEQVAGKKVDGRADLFSLGVMLYEMLTGQKPFDGDSLATLLFRISNEAHPDPTTYSRERVTPAIKAVIDKALQKSPDNRYQAGSDMAKDLRACLQSTQTSIAEPAPETSPAPVDTPQPDEPLAITTPNEEVTQKMGVQPPQVDEPVQEKEPEEDIPQEPMPIPFTTTEEEVKQNAGSSSKPDEGTMNSASGELEIETGGTRAPEPDPEPKPEPEPESDSSSSEPEDKMRL